MMRFDGGIYLHIWRDVRINETLTVNPSIGYAIAHSHLADDPGAGGGGAMVYGDVRFCWRWQWPWQLKPDLKARWIAEHIASGGGATDSNLVQIRPLGPPYGTSTSSAILHTLAMAFQKVSYTLLKIFIKHNF